MTNVDAPTAVQQWFSAQRGRWQTNSIAAEFRLPSGNELNKAVATLKTPSHVASVTVWGSGTLEFIVLDVATQAEVTIEDKEYKTADDLHRLLDECAESFARIVRPH